MEAKKMGPYGELPKNLPTCHTVSELIDVLERLPGNLPVNLMDEGVRPVIYNQRHADAHLRLENGEDWEDECDEESA